MQRRRKKLKGSNIIYDTSYTHELYNDILQAIVNIENACKLESDRVIQYRYNEAIQKRWWGLVKPKFEGTIEQFKETYSYSNLEYNKAFNKLKVFEQAVSDAVRDNLVITLAFSDHNLIQKCLVANKDSSYYHNRGCY